MAAELDALKKQVHGMVDREKLMQIACDLVDIPSPTGYEKPCADYILARYKAAGIAILPQVFEEERSNAIGVLKGDGTGPTLMLNGHMDTSYTGKERYLPDKPGYKPKAIVDGEWIYGLGIYNMKGSLACFIHAVEILKAANVKLKGDLVIAAVAGEIEKSQVDDFQGPLYRGGACGTWYAITHGAIADFCVVGEPSGMTLCRAHGGYVWTKITLTGDPMHTVFGQKKDNTINNMMKIMEAVQAWGDEYEVRRSKYGMRAHVTLSAIEGGWAYRCSRVPVHCTLYVDTRLLPDQEPLEVQREIEPLVAGLKKKDPDLDKLGLEMNVFMNQWASECGPEEYIFQQVAKSHEEVHASPIEVTALPVASDACELTRHGIPSLNYGATGRTRSLSPGFHYDKAQSDWNPQQGEHASIEDMLKTTKVYLSLILNICSKTREELGIKPKDADHKH
jgi:acetylornithine deacetylase/succinyl-diaminopimelate desuccinylase-like protein